MRKRTAGVALICSGDADQITYLALNLEDEHILGFEIHGTKEELAVFDRLANRQQFGDRVIFNEADKGVPHRNQIVGYLPFVYDNRELPQMTYELLTNPRF